MSVREQIIEMMQDAGYDVFTACEEADRIIAEFRASDQKEMKVTIRHGSGFTLARKQ